MGKFVYYIKLLLLCCNNILCYNDNKVFLRKHDISPSFQIVKSRCIFTLVIRISKEAAAYIYTSFFCKICIEFDSVWHVPISGIIPKCFSVPNRKIPNIRVFIPQWILFKFGILIENKYVISNFFLEITISYSLG